MISRQDRIEAFVAKKWAASQMRSEWRARWPIVLRAGRNERPIATNIVDERGET